MGRTCTIVEKWNPFAKVRQDLFGFIDVLCLNDGEIVGVQATSDSNHSTRKIKILAHENYPKWVKANGKVEVWSWKKKMVGKRPKYESRIEIL